MAQIIRNGISIKDVRSHSNMRFIDTVRPKHGVQIGPYVYREIIGAPYENYIKMVNFLAYRKSLKHWWNIVDYTGIIDDFVLEDPDFPAASHEIAYVPFKSLPGDAQDVDIIIPEFSPNFDYLGVAFRYQATKSSGMTPTYGQVRVSLSQLGDDPDVDSGDFGYNLWVPHISGGDQRSGLVDTLRSDVDADGNTIFGKSSYQAVAWGYGFTLQPNLGGDPDDITDNKEGFRALNIRPDFRDAGGPYKLRFSANSYARIIAAYAFEMPWRIEDANIVLSNEKETFIGVDDFYTGFPT